MKTVVSCSHTRHLFTLPMRIRGKTWGNWDVPVVFICGVCWVVITWPECWTLSQDHLPALTVTASRETQTFDHLKKNLSYSRLHNNTTLLSCGGSEPPWVTADSLWSSHSGPFQWESRVKPTGSSTRQLQRQTVLVRRGMIFENCPAQMQSIILSRGQVSAQ